MRPPAAKRRLPKAPTARFRCGLTNGALIMAARPSAPPLRDISERNGSSSYLGIGLGSTLLQVLQSACVRAKVHREQGPPCSFSRSTPLIKRMSIAGGAGSSKPSGSSTTSAHEGLIPRRLANRHRKEEGAEPLLSKQPVLSERQHRRPGNDQVIEDPDIHQRQHLLEIPRQDFVRTRGLRSARRMVVNQQ